jgi:hypothetical protein
MKLFSSHRHAIIFPISQAWFVLGITLLTGSPFLSIGIYESVKITAITRNTVETTGTIVENEFLIDPSNIQGYSPIVEFTTREGRSIRYLDLLFTSDPAFEPGEKIAVIYRKENPENAHIVTGIWRRPMLFLIIGCIPFIAGIIVLFTQRRA